MNRRTWIAGAAAATAAGCGQAERKIAAGPAGKSAVAILKAANYSVDLLDVLRRGAAVCGLDARGKRVLLKPNLVEFDAATVINTNVAVLAAAVELFKSLGAAEVRIGEGPGHRRDTIFIAEQARYRGDVEKFDSLFTDLNRDDIADAGQFADLKHMWMPKTVLAADLIVSVAKMKTHHWAAATLSMKNYFGLVPGSVYGWPKNELHRIGINESVAELNRMFGAKSFAIVDGVVGMEGNGPIDGTPKAAGVIVMGADLIAVDATCCRVMGLKPEQVEYLRATAARGHVLEAGIEQRGERVAAVRMPFQPSPNFADLAG